MKGFPTLVPHFLLFMSLTTLQAQIGDPAPDFTVTDTHGKTHHLYDYLDAGHVVVLDFFYTTCIPCQFYSPQVNLAYEKYGCNTDKVIFISMDHNDTDAEVLTYDAEYHIEFPSISGLEGGGNGVVSQYGIFGFPTFYVIDSTRTIIDQIDPPTLQVFDFRFGMHGIEPAECSTSSITSTIRNVRLEVYPNPVHADQNLWITIPGQITGTVAYKIMDLYGRVVHREQVQEVSGDFLKFDAARLATGMYVIQLSSDETHEIYTGVCIKQ